MTRRCPTRSRTYKASRMDVKSTYRLYVGIATAGRRDILSASVQQLAKQLRLPDKLIICPAEEQDCDRCALDSLPFPVGIVFGPRGLTSQRNAIIASCSDADAVVFFDDDFYPAPSYLAEVENMLIRYPDVVIARGRLLADGVCGPGLDHKEALGMLESSRATSPEETAISDIYGVYGCNMTLRMATVLAHGVRFDENLPLYGWLEDIDFSRSVASYGRIIMNRRLYGVHLGTKRGRTSGVKFGYSQIANPIYMLRKGTMNRSYAFRHMGRNVASNIAKFIVPEPWVDRRGRLKGNAIACFDLICGRLHPRNVLHLD